MVVVTPTQTSFESRARPYPRLSCRRTVSSSSQERRTFSSPAYDGNWNTANPDFRAGLRCRRFGSGRSQANHIGSGCGGCDGLRGGIDEERSHCFDWPFVGHYLLRNAVMNADGSDASLQVASEAVDKGARMITHLFK